MIHPSTRTDSYDEGYGHDLPSPSEYEDLGPVRPQPPSLIPWYMHVTSPPIPEEPSSVSGLLPDLTAEAGDGPEEDAESREEPLE